MSLPRRSAQITRAPDKLVVVSGEDWPVGLLGLVANRLLDTLWRHGGRRQPKRRYLPGIGARTGRREPRRGAGPRARTAALLRRACARGRLHRRGGRSGRHHRHAARVYPACGDRHKRDRRQSRRDRRRLPPAVESCHVELLREDRRAGAVWAGLSGASVRGQSAYACCEAGRAARRDAICGCCCAMASAR